MISIMMVILIFFAFIFILVLAFSSSKKQTQVRKIDPKTGKETIEIHESNSPSAAQTAARTVLWIIGILLLVIGGLSYYFLSPFLSPQYTCEVCVDFQGRVQCRTAKGADQNTAKQTAHDNACAFLVNSKTEGFLCGQTLPARVTCQEH